MMKAVLFKSPMRFESFLKKLLEYGIDVQVLDFESHQWLDYDYSGADFLIYYPVFKYSSNHPLALQEIYDNISFISERYPELLIYPDPKLSRYYNDKYRQYLFLHANRYPIPETIPLFSEESVHLAEKKLGYPVVVKNRFGAGGGSVFQAFNRRDLMAFYRMSKMDLVSIGAVKHMAGLARKRAFWYHLLKAKKAYYPFFSFPVIAQKFIQIDRDLKTVTCRDKVMEAHWRYQADPSMWKVNIDGGGTGVWEKVPQEAMDLSIRLAKDLEAFWLNVDLLWDGRRFWISEFSPVWHHYAYREKPSFIYRDDYNIDVPLEISLDLERIIIESMIDALKH